MSSKAARIAAAVIGFAALAASASAQIRVNPTGVNVNGHGATTAFLTFGRLQGYVPAEGLWCGELIATGLDVGAKCDPSTIYGVLPARYDRSRRSSIDAFTDIMSIPPSVTRRAYQAAAAGKNAAFFFVRHFISSAGGRDQYVAVTCRLTSGGARVPLSIVDVALGFDVETPVLHVKHGAPVPQASARIVYTGTGRLTGRWEIVLPGQELPSPEDLLTEASLPVEERGTQRRFVETGRFNVFLSATGRYTLPGPDPERLPTAVDGQYVLLLRIEVSDDKEADSDLSAIGVGSGVVHAGAVAGFPMPTLLYVVGTGGSELSPSGESGTGAMWPADGSIVPAGGLVDLQWLLIPQTAYYRIEIETGGKLIHAALIGRAGTTYRVPPFVTGKAVAGELRWRVVAIDGSGHDATKGGWRRLGVANEVINHAPGGAS